MWISNDLVNPVLAWRAVGSASWAGILTIAATCSLGFFQTRPSLLYLLFSWISWRTLAQLIAQTPAFLAHLSVITPTEPTPRSFIRAAPWSRGAVIVSKLTARIYSTPTALLWAAYLASTTVSAVLSIWASLPSSSSSPSFLLIIIYAAFLAIIHTTNTTVYFSTDVICFPTIQRHRYFRLKQQLPKLLKHALFTALLPLPPTIILSLFTNNSTTTTTTTLPPLTSWPSIILSGTLCSFCWLAIAASIDTIFSERLKPDDYSDNDVLAAMSGCLAGKNGPMMQALALYDLQMLGEEGGGGVSSRQAWRRRDVFNDDSGEVWKSIAEPCIAQLTQLIDGICPLPSSVGAKQTSSNGRRTITAGSPTRWNALPAVLQATMGTVTANQTQLLRVAATRSMYQNAAASCRSLSSLALASLSEDRYGILQLTQPGLGDVVMVLLGSLRAVQSVLRSTSGLPQRAADVLGPWSYHGSTEILYSNSNSNSYGGGMGMGIGGHEGAALAMKDVLVTELHALVDAFGDGLVQVVKEKSSGNSSRSSGSIGGYEELLREIMAGHI